MRPWPHPVPAFEPVVDLRRAQLEAFQSGVEATLLFVQQAVEKGNGRPQLLLFRIARLELGLASGRLFLATNPVWSGVKVEPALGLAAQALLLHQLAQGILDRDVQDRFQLVGKAAGRCRADESLDRVQQRAVP